MTTAITPAWSGFPTDGTDSPAAAASPSGRLSRVEMHLPLGSSCNSRGERRAASTPLTSTLPVPQRDTNGSFIELSQGVTPPADDRVCVLELEAKSLFEDLAVLAAKRSLF